jgi:hypothetical protein
MGLSHFALIGSTLILSTILFDLKLGGLAIATELG